MFRRVSFHVVSYLLTIHLASLSHFILSHIYIYALADTFIQGDLQYIQVIHVVSVCVSWELNNLLHC